MNAAAATSAMHKTLRPGRVEVLRNPIIVIGNTPCPEIVCFLSPFNHANQKDKIATSNNVPAPKNPPTCPINFKAAAPSNNSPRKPKTTPTGAAPKNLRRGRPLTIDNSPSIVPPRRLRGEAGDKLRNVHQMQTIAVTMPPIDPINKDRGVI